MSPDQEACFKAINARLDALHALESAFKRNNEAEGF